MEAPERGVARHGASGGALEPPCGVATVNTKENEQGTTARASHRTMHGQGEGQHMRPYACSMQDLPAQHADARRTPNACLRSARDTECPRGSLRGGLVPPRTLRIKRAES